jgi:hypothetical protein
MREVGSPFANFEEEKCLHSSLGKHILGGNGLSISLLWHCRPLLLTVQWTVAPYENVSVCQVHHLLLMHDQEEARYVWQHCTWAADERHHMVIILWKGTDWYSHIWAVTEWSVSYLEYLQNFTLLACSLTTADWYNSWIYVYDERQQKGSTQLPEPPMYRISTKRPNFVEAQCSVFLFYHTLQCTRVAGHVCSVTSSHHSTWWKGKRATGEIDGRRRHCTLAS